MPFDVGQFITPFPGPYRYSSPASVPNVMEIPRLEEAKRSAKAQEELLREQNEGARRSAAAKLEWDQLKFGVERQDKFDEEKRALLSKFIGRATNQDWAGANALAAEMRARGIPIERTGAEPEGVGGEAAQTPAGAKAPVPEAPAVPSAAAPPAGQEEGYSYSDLEPMAGVRATPRRAVSFPGAEFGVQSQWLEGGGQGAPPPTPSETAKQQAERQAEKNAFQLWARNQYQTGGSRAPAPPQVAPGASREERVKAFQAWAQENRPEQFRPQPQVPGAPAEFVPPQEKPGWVIRDRQGNETFRLNDDEVSAWRGRVFAQTFGQRLAEAKTPGEKKAAQEGFRVGMAAVASGLPMEEAQERAQKAYEFEIEQANAMKRAEIVAWANAQRAARGEIRDPVKLRQAAVDDVRTGFSTAKTQEVLRTTQVLVNMLDKEGYNNGTTNNAIITTVLKAYGDARIADPEYVRAVTASGISSVFDQWAQYLKDNGRIPPEVMKQNHALLREKLMELADRMQQAGDAAYHYVADTYDVDPASGDHEGRIAATTIYRYWRPPSPPKGGAVQPMTPGSSSRHSSTLKVMEK
jgi:hypothetical protein